MRRSKFKTSKPTVTVRGGSSATNPLRSSLFDNTPLRNGCATILGFNVLGYLISLLTTTHYHVDLLGTGAFGVAALSTLKSPSLHTKLSAAAVVAWSARLASFLFYRVSKSGHDNRLDEILPDPFYSAGFWTFSAAWGVLCSLPHFLGATSSVAVPKPILFAGLSLFGVGWFFEVGSDYQKWVFKKENPGKFCDVGLWSLSQHPNWFGNLLLWTGILVMNAPSLIEPVKGTLFQRVWRFRRLALACVGPAFMLYLFDAQATGKMLGDSLEANKQKYGYGKDPAFTNYIDDTPLIFPNPFK